MEVKAKSRYVRISPTKARDLCRQLKGLSVADALKLTDFAKRKAGKYVGKTLKSAVANAENNAELPVSSLRVKNVVVDEGPFFVRYWPRARGMVSVIRRRTSHITVVLTDDNKSAHQAASQNTAQGAGES
jgi:large subunit ribosomal protein L22